VFSVSVETPAAIVSADTSAVPAETRPADAPGSD